MASRIFPLCFLVILASLTWCIRGTPLKLSLDFSVLSPPEVIAQRNHPLLLNCSGHSEAGSLQTLWRHQGVAIHDSHQVLPNGSLYIEQIVSQKKYDRRDDGNYTCLLQNNVGTLVSRPVQVSIARMSRTFSVEPQPLTTFQGGYARFTCQIHAVPPAAVTWFHNGHELPQNDSRYTLLPSGILQISGVSMADAGNYNCHCSNIARQRVSKAAYLTVLPGPEKFQPPYFLSSAESVWGTVKDAVILECLANGFPHLELMWKREDKVIIPKEQTTILGNGNLLFQSLKPEDSGAYICTAKVFNPDTGQAAVEHQKTVLSVFVPPKFANVPLNQVKHTAQTARFECTVDGNPAPSIQWLKNGEPLYINGRINLKTGNILVISQTIASDSGIYQCVASNAAGVDTVAARLQVTASSDQPLPPTGLKAHTVSSSSIELSWNPAISPNGLDIQAYTVHFLPTSGGMEMQKVAKNTTQLIEKLQPYTNYTFYVRVYNGKSASEQSETVTQMTGEDVPISAPTVSLTSISPTALKVSWNKLPAKEIRGVVTGYRIHYRKHKQASYSVIEVSNVGTEYTITGLTPKKKYDVRVMSGTKAGFPVLSEEEWPWVVYEMPDAVTAKVPLPPILHLTVANTTAIEVGWSMPTENTHPVEGFHLSYRQQSHPLKGPINLPASETKFLLHDLAPQTWYEVHLISYNTEGESRESVRNIITFSGNSLDMETVEVVEPPQQLEAYPTSSASIHLVWKTPETGKNISYYTVQYHSVLANGLVNESLISYIRSTNSEVIIPDLSPFTLYAFSVRSHDVHNRQGPFSQKVECKTEEDIPSAPQDLTWTPADTNSIRLNWQPPKFSNGIILKYIIMSSMHLENPQHMDKWVLKEEGGTELSSTITGLASNTLYYLCMKAENKAGMSAGTPLIAVNIPVRYNNSRQPSQEVFDADPQDPFLGIVVGISIGIGCIIICAIIIICRNRCCPPPLPPPPASDGRYTICCGNGHVPQLNGHVSGSKPNSEKWPSTECQELDCFTPMLNNFPNGTGEHHLDTKGGYPTASCNGKTNGYPHQLLGNSHSSLCNHPNSTEYIQETDQESGPIFKQRMRYQSSDCVQEGSWPELSNVNSSTVLLHEGNNRTQSDTVQSGDSSHQYGEPDSTFCTTNGARMDQSSCNILTRTSNHIPASLSEIVTHSIVPPGSSAEASLGHISFKALDESKDSVPSIPPSSQEKDEHCSPCIVASGANSLFLKETTNHSSLPFSVNSFPSPLSSPRFSQSSIHIPSELT